MVPGAVRASIGLHNSPDDLEYLFQALRAIIERRFSDRYKLDSTTGEYTPVDWTPAYDDYFRV
jgi:hypothetical protein